MRNNEKNTDEKSKYSAFILEYFEDTKMFSG